MKIAPLFLLSIILFISAGCAVIDFLDGKHLNNTPDYDRLEYKSGGGGGHSH